MQSPEMACVRVMTRSAARRLSVTLGCCDDQPPLVLPKGCGQASRELEAATVRLSAVQPSQKPEQTVGKVHEPIGLLLGTPVQCQLVTKRASASSATSAAGNLGLTLTAATETGRLESESGEDSTPVAGKIDAIRNMSKLLVLNGACQTESGCLVGKLSFGLFCSGALEAVS